MLEIVFFLLGAGFSLLVYYRSIRPVNLPAARKLAYFVPTFIGITGIVWLFGVLVAHVLRTRHIIP